MSTVATEKLSPDERKASLARLISNKVHEGWRVESQSDYQAIMVRGHRPNHILHLILSIITLGIWLIVWLLVAAWGGEKRRTLMVDEFGNGLFQ